MLYDLVVDGAADFWQRRPSAQRLVRLEPLVGLVDSTNKLFKTAHAPFLAASLKVYPPNSVTAVVVDTVDADGGVVFLHAAPTAPQVASYTSVPVTAQQLLYVAYAGMQLLESIWPRGLLLSSDANLYTQAVPTDTKIYVVVRNPDGSVSDPPCGNLTFSTSFAQRNLLGRCIEFAYSDALVSDSAAGDLNVRERAGGIAIDASRRTGNLINARAQAWDELMKAWYAAMDEYSPNGDHYGGSIEPPHTGEYESVWHWQTAGGLLVPSWTKVW